MIWSIRRVLRMRSTCLGGFPSPIFVPPPRGETASPSRPASFMTSLVSSMVPGSITWAGSVSASEVLRQAGLLDRVHVEGAGTLATEAGRREDLAGVADPVRVEGAPE